MVAAAPSWNAAARLAPKARYCTSRKAHAPSESQERETDHPIGPG
jgi:hypothetical protein